MTPTLVHRVFVVFLILSGMELVPFEFLAFYPWMVMMYLTIR